MGSTITHKVNSDSFARLQALEEAEQQCEEFNQMFGFKDEKFVSSKFPNEFQKENQTKTCSVQCFSVETNSYRVISI